MSGGGGKVHPPLKFFLNYVPGPGRTSWSPLTATPSGASSSTLTTWAMTRSWASIYQQVSIYLSIYLSVSSIFLAYLSICLTIYTSICLSIYLCVKHLDNLGDDEIMGLNLPTGVYLSVSSIYPLYLSLCQASWQPGRRRDHGPKSTDRFLSICLSVYLSVYLSVCLSVYLSICFFSF